MSRLKDLTAFEKRCAVTAFDMKIQLNRDGRERGMWVFLEDQSDARYETTRQWLDTRVDIIAKMMDFDDDSSMKFRLAMNLHGDIGPLLNGRMREAALMEWPAALKFYEALGKEIEKARERGDLSTKKTNKTKPKKVKKK